MKRKTLAAKHILAAGLFVLLIAALAFIYAAFREKTQTGSKQITIEVVSRLAQSTVYHVKTDAQYLLGAMQDAEGLTFAGDNGPYGMMIHTVNGETAVYDVNQSYWSFYVNGEYCNYGVSDQPIADGDAFKIAYTQ